MINIHLRVDGAFHKRMMIDKMQLSAKLQKEVTWETYIEHLFGIRRAMVLK
jgi:hypothetical protein